MQTKSIRTNASKHTRYCPRVSCWLIGLVLLTSLSGCGGATLEEPAARGVGSGEEAVIAGTVELLIDFSDPGKRSRKFVVPCSAESTVFDILQRAENMDDLEFESSGTGEMVFINSIGGVANERSGEKSWVFRVNGELGDRSCGVYRVEVGDQVEWRFGSYRPSEE